MGPAWRLFYRSAGRIRPFSTSLTCYLRPFRSSANYHRQFQPSRRPVTVNFRRPSRGSTSVLLSTSGAAALGTLAFVELSEDGDNSSDKTWEARLLETSRTELEASKTTKGREQTNSLTRVLYRVLYFIDIHIWEPLCTGARFLHLTVIFVPVLLAVPVMWVGRKQSDRDNERAGALWWYAFLVQAMEWAGPAFIKVSVGPRKYVSLLLFPSFLSGF